MVTADSPITCKADLEGKKISVQTGTTAEEYCMDNGYEVLSFTANNDAAAALTTGKVDAWVVDNEVAVALAAQQGLTVLDEAMTSEPYAFAFAKGSDELVSSYGLTCDAADVELVESDKEGGTIVWQSLEAGTEVDEGSAIQFRVSAGLANSTVPITVDLPQNGSDTVQVEIYVGDEPTPQYSELVHTSDGTVNTTISSTGKKMVKVYFDGVLDQDQSYELKNDVLHRGFLIPLLIKELPRCGNDPALGVAAVFLCHWRTSLCHL